LPLFRRCLSPPRPCLLFYPPTLQDVELFPRSSASHSACMSLLMYFPSLVDSLRLAGSTVTSDSCTGFPEEGFIHTKGATAFTPALVADACDLFFFVLFYLRRSGQSSNSPDFRFARYVFSYSLSSFFSFIFFLAFTTVFS